MKVVMWKQQTELMLYLQSSELISNSLKKYAKNRSENAELTSRAIGDEIKQFKLQRKVFPDLKIITIKNKVDQIISQQILN